MNKRAVQHSRVSSVPAFFRYCRIYSGDIELLLIILIAPLDATYRKLRFGYPFERIQKCERPCEREPYWISFDAIMDLGDNPNSLRPLLRPKQREGVSDFMVDVGQCSGFCKQSLFPLYHDSVVSFSPK